MSRAWIGLALLAGAWTGLAAEEGLTLAMALHQAGAGSLQADLAGLAVRDAQGDQDQVRAAYLPELQVQGGHLNQDQETVLKGSPISATVPGLGTLSVPGVDTPIAQASSWRYQITASYLLWDFGRRDSALAAARARQSAVGFRGQDAVRRAQAEAAARYMAVMDLQARDRVLAQRRQALQDHLRDAQALFDQGVVARNDLLRTEVALRAVADAQRTLANARVTAREGLNMALGLAPEAPQTLPEQLPPPPALPWTEAQVRLQAPAANLGIKALEAKLQAAEDQVDFRRRDFAPNVVAQLGHSYEENQYLVHPDQTTLYLGVSWKLFDGGTRSARVGQSRAGAESVRRELREARFQAADAGAAAWRDFQEALAELVTAQADVAASQENLRIVTDQYQQAYAKSADVLDAEAVLAESRSSLSDRLCRAYTHQAELLALLGEDLEAFYVNRPGEP
jgi:outer membrane protein TolC